MMRIALALDGSPSSAQARDLVASLRWPEGTNVTLVAAYEFPPIWFAGEAAVGDWLSHAEPELRREAEARLGSMAAALESRGLSVDLHVAKGRPADVILAFADEADADLIVVGSRGLGQVGSMLLGSTSAEVAGEARCSVLVARGSTVSRLLVATDGSECASSIPDALARWDLFDGLPAVALSIAPVDSPTFRLLVKLYTLGNEPPELQTAALEEVHRRHATEAAERLSDRGIKAEAEVRLGDAAREIIESAAAHQADLVVTGSRCLRGMDRWFIGSVARNVLLHTHASVLVIRPKRTRPES